MQTNSCLNDSNCKTDLVALMRAKVPLRVLIRQMLDEAFGKPNRTTNVTEDQCNFEKKNCSHNEANDCPLLHKSVSDCTKHENNNLTNMEEESTNSLHHLDSIECTGIYLSRLLKSNDKLVDRIKRDNSLQSRRDTEISASQVDIDSSINNSLCCTKFVEKESSICQQNNYDRNESGMNLNTILSFSDIDVSSDNDNTANFFTAEGNSLITKKVPYKSLSSLKLDRTESSIDASLVSKSSFVSTPTFNNVPLHVLIRRILDEAFKKPNRTNESKNCDIDTSLKSLKDESISSHNEANDCLLHKSVSNRIKHENSKLISIEEENTNSLLHSNSIENTGKYLSRLLKSNDKLVDRIKHDNPLQSRRDTEISSSQVDIDSSINNSLCCTKFVEKESSICQQNNYDRNDSGMILNAIPTFSDNDVSSDNDNTANFFTAEGNGLKTKKVPYESLSSLKLDRTESSIDASLVSKSAFVSTLTLERRTPKSSSSTNNKLFKTPRYNTTVVKKIKCRSSFHMKMPKNVGTPKISKVYQNQAKSFKLHGCSKQGLMVGPQITITPATPTSIS